MADPVPPDYSKRLKAIRQKLNLTQKRLAEIVGVSFASINRWENGHVKPNRLAWQKISNAETLGIQALVESKPAIKEPQDEYQSTNSSGIKLDFSAPADLISIIIQGYRLAYGHQINNAFATETSRIDPLPHQRVAVYERMLPQPRLRFLLADDAGAGKTIMAGLYIREMLARRLIRRVLIVPPAGLVSNWEREMRMLFSLHFQIVGGADARKRNPFFGPESDLVIISVDTLAGERTFGRLCESETQPYELVIFDEAHKLAADREPDFRVRKTDRYRLAEALAGVTSDQADWQLPWSAGHILLLTATPHMGKDYPYYCLWRLLEPEVLSTFDAFTAYPSDARARHFIRRTKEEMVRFDGSPIYPTRVSDTLGYELTQGNVSEQALYNQATAYIEYYYNRARILNRSAARLAMSVFQRRLASSTWALLCSLERRLERLNGLIADIQSGKITPQQLLARQRKLDDEAHDLQDELTADEEGSEDDGSGNPIEAHEKSEAQVLGAVVATSLAELEVECQRVEDLLTLAKQVYAKGHESKFDKLIEVLHDPRFQAEKLIIFTEHRDTLNFLVRRLEGMGYTGEIVQIHGGMGRFERDTAVELFRKSLNQGGARYLIATDAAGEGINLQVCWLMVNYDIPWNPARLEQRMGRIHRYGQKHDPVLILNLVASKTREGRVVQTLLEKLERIRKELHSDKVFDVVGRLFEGVSLRTYLEGSLSEEGLTQALQALEGRLTPDQVSAIQERERRLFGDGGDIKRELPRLNADLDKETFRRLLPGYVRSFVEGAAPFLGLGFEGDLGGEFSLRSVEPGALDTTFGVLWPVLETYPPKIRNLFSFSKPKDDHPAIFLHPGEPFFDKFLNYFLILFSTQALSGGVFVDSAADQPYLFHLAEGSVLRQGDPQIPALGQDEILETRLLGLQETASGAITPCPVERLLLLRGRKGLPIIPLAVLSFASLAQSRLLTVQEAFYKQLIEPLAAAHADAISQTLADREAFLKLGYTFQEAELAASRARYTEKANSGDPRARGELTRIKERQRSLASQRAQALLALNREPELICAGQATFLVHALVVPSSAPDEIKHRVDRIEALAMQVAMAHEAAAGAKAVDIHTPELARAAGLSDYPGFDVLSYWPDGSERAIEVKGRAQAGMIDISTNEWGAACNHGQKYWLYVVYDCATSQPRLFRIRDPFGKMIAKARGFMLEEGEIIAQAEEKHD